MIIYRGISRYQTPHFGFTLYTPSIGFARQFTQSGRPGEIIKATIDEDSIKALPRTPYGGDEEEMEAAYQYARHHEIHAFWVDEGQETPSIAVLRSAIGARVFRNLQRCDETDLEGGNLKEQEDPGWWGTDFADAAKEFYEEHFSRKPPAVSHKGPGVGDKPQTTGADQNKMTLQEQEDPEWWGVDFDGTLAHYDEWEGASHVGAPIKGTIDLVKKILRSGHAVKIFTARVADPKQRRAATDAIEKFCQKHFGRKLPVTNQKDPGMVGLIDDKVQMIRMAQNKGTVRERSVDKGGLLEKLLRAAC